MDPETLEVHSDLSANFNEDEFPGKEIDWEKIEPGEPDEGYEYAEADQDGGDSGSSESNINSDL